MRRIVGIYAFCHFAVDFCCIATMLCVVSPALGNTGPLTAAAAIVVYDVFAFMLQLPIGAALDGRVSGAPAALLAYALVACGGIIAYLPGIPFAIAATLLAAVGNAIFHCAGGVDVLRISEGRAAPPGIFISTGAFGVFLGGMATTVFGSMLRGAVLAFMLVSAMLTASLAPAHAASDVRLPIKAPNLSPVGFAAVGLLAITVALRSYAGMVMAFPWKGEFVLAVVAICSVVAGKALGGVIADRIGLERASIISLGLSAPLFPLAFEHPAAGITATLLFNFTMPITLISLAELMPKNRGMAFGIASFSLAVGFCPVLVGIRAASGPALCIISLISLAALLAGLALARRSVDG